MKPWRRLPQIMGTALLVGMILHQAHAQDAVDPKTIKKNPRVNNLTETGVMLAEARPEKLF